MVRKIVKRLTFPLLKLEEGKTVAVKVLVPMFVGKPQKDAHPGDKPADLVNVVNLDTGEEMQMIVNAILKSQWEENYPDATYVGKCFEITKGAKLATKSGRSVTAISVSEVED